MKRPKHIPLGFIDIPKDYIGFTDEDKKIFCDMMIDKLLHVIEKELKFAPEINRITFLDSILDSSLITNVDNEAFEVACVIRDMKKQLALDA